MGIDVLTKWKSVFSQSGFFTDIFVWIGWKLAQGLKFLCDAAQTLVDEMYKLIDFTSYASLNKLFTTSEIRMLLAVLFAFAFIVLGITLVFQQDKERPKVLQNILIAVMVITALPSLMTMLNGLTLNAKDAILGTQSKVSEQVIADNTVDLLYLDKQGFGNYDVKDGRVTGGNVNGFQGTNAKNIAYIDATETINEDYKNKLNSPDYFYNLIKVNDNGTIQVEELKSDKFFGIEQTNFYYRYDIDYGVIYISLLATILTFCFTAYKVAKMIFDLAVHGVLATIIAASDLTSGQRTKQVLQSIGSIYAVLVLAVLMIKFYLLGSVYISSKITNGLVKAIALIFFALAVIDGPNIIEKIFGIDVGLRSGFQTMATIFMATTMGTRAVGALSHGAAKMTAAAAGTAAGAFGGIKDAKNNFKTEMNKGEQNNSQTTETQNSDSSANNLYGDRKSEATADRNDKNGLDKQGENGSSNTPSDNLRQQDENGSQNTPIDSSAAANLSGIGTEDGNSQATENLTADNLSGDSGEKPKLNDSAKQNLEQARTAPNEYKGNANSRSARIHTNPNGIIGTAQRAYNTTRGIGGQLGTKAGQAAKKRADKKANINIEENK